MAHGSQPRGPFSRFVNDFEESAIATILGLMTLLTFVNVVMRYLFNSSFIWVLETVTFLFAWLVLLGVSYAVKKTANLGVDTVINLFSKPVRRTLALIAGVICVIYAFMLLKGAWDYWANFANLPKTTGRWFPTGFEEMRATSYRAWYGVEDIPFPEWLRWIEPIMNEGEEYEKLPRFIPYVVLPLSMALLLYRFCQATWRIWAGHATSLIVSHEAEDAVEDARRAQEGT